MRYIEPRKILDTRLEGKERPDWDAVVLIFRDARGSRIIKEALGCEEYGDQVFWGMEAGLTHEVTVNGNKKAGVIEQCLWGGPQAAILVEEVAELGIDTVIGIGACGSTVPRLPKGSQVYATRSLTTCGASKEYTGEASAAPSGRLVTAVESLDGRKPVPAVAATVDAIYRETRELVDSLAGRGAEVINMESSAFYAASALCNLGSLWIGHVSDCIAGDSWEDWSNIEDITRESAYLCRALLEEAVGRENRGTDAQD